MVIGASIAASLTTTGIVSQRYSRLTVEAEPHGLVRLVRPVFALNVLEDSKQRPGSFFVVWL